MILADENLHPRLIQSLRSSGVDVFSVKGNNRGISDEEIIIALSKDPPRILLTEDKDHHEKSISVIFTSI